MSRIGKKPVILPAGVEVSLQEVLVTVRGPKGSVTVPVPAHAHVELQSEPKALSVSVDTPDNVHDRAIWGLLRQLLQNAVDGVQKPFETSLEFIGVGFKVALEGHQVSMDVGFSHKVVFPLPEGIDAKVDKQVLSLSGVDKHLVGEMAAQIRRIRPPEPYKGKGIKYVDEVIRRKAGKTAKTVG